MSLLLLRLKKLGFEMSSAQGALFQGCPFSAKKLLFPKKTIEQLMRQHLVLHLEYGVQCANIAQLMTTYSKSDPLTQQLIAQEILAAYLLAKVLNHLYRHCLDVPREVNRLERDCFFYQQFLSRYGYDTQKNEVLKILGSTHSITRSIRDLTPRYNRPRLILVRMKKVLLQIATLFPEGNLYTHSVHDLDAWVSPIFSYLSWIAFSPRLLVNLLLLAKHLIPHAQMPEDEKKISLKIRLKSQLERRWFELTNDLIWVAGGVINCFVWIGSKSIYGVWLSFGLFFMDILIAGFRAHWELSRLSRLQMEYLSLNSQTTFSPEILFHATLLAQLNKRIEFEKERLFLSVFLAIGLWMAVTLGLPVFSGYPAVQFLGALLLVTVTLANEIAQSLLRQKLPNENHLEILQRESHGSFKTELRKPISLALQQSGLFKSAQMTPSLSDNHLAGLNESSTPLMRKMK